MDDSISRQAAQTELMMKCERYTLVRESHGMGHVEWSSDLISVADAMDAIRDLPPAQPEITDEQAIGHLQASGWMQSHDKQMYEMGLKERLADDSDSYDALLPSSQPETNCSEIPNASDFVSRKAVRKMVSSWAYDLMEQEDLNMALHDVDELPPVQPEVIHCKDCKHRDPEDKKCDCGHDIMWQLPRPDEWFCADGERKDGEEE